jgi:glyoxylase-like metal-dependent hydrolase (beta-lactamase superfamily II)
MYSCENLHWVEDQQSILVGKIPVKVVLTPGHSSGGVCYWADGDLFTGDTLFSEGCGICDQAGGSPSAMFDSFQKLRNLIPRETRIWPGHSFGKEPGMTLAEVIETNIYFHLLDREEFIRFRMRNSPLDPMRFQ